MKAAAMMSMAVPGVALASSPSEVREPATLSRAPGDLRLKAAPPRSNPALTIDDPRSMLRTGYGGSMIDLFPFEGGNFHLSGGGRLFGRAGRPRLLEPEPLRLLPAFRAGGRASRRLSPALLVGYGRVLERGLAFGIDAGLVLGRITQTPDRLGRLNRERLESGLWRGRREGMNQLARVTALYRF